VRGRENSTEDEQSEAAPRTPSTLLEGSMPRDSYCGAMPAFSSSLSLSTRAAKARQLQRIPSTSVHPTSEDKVHQVRKCNVHSPPSLAHVFHLPSSLTLGDSGRCKVQHSKPAWFPYSASSDSGALQASSIFGTLQTLIFGTLQALTSVPCKQALFLVPCKLWFLVLCKLWLWCSASELCFW
jgi:hypothetical protein